MRAWTLSFVLLSLVACGGELPSPTDASTTAEVSADVPVDVPVADTGPSPIVTVRDPARVPVPSWRTAVVVNPANGDPVGTALETGAFTELPPEDMAHGVFWEATPTGENSRIADAPRGSLFYAAAEVEAPSGTRLFARADFALALYGPDGRQPGDVYGSGRIRVPVPTGDSRSLLVVRALGGRGTTAVEIFSTPDEVVLNLDDATLPDLAVGDGSEQWAGVPVLNLTDAPLVGAVALVEGGEVFTETRVELPALAPRAVTQVPFRLARRAPTAMPAQMLTVQLRVEAPGLRSRYRRPLVLATVAADATRRVTRRSAVDGSVQYYGLVPPRPFDPARRYGVVLSLHGAGVEGIGQARAYSPKDWTYVVAPTNRRPFGFDWEEWGRLDALEALDHAQQSLRTDPTRVYLTGHSMGGHGTWNVGVHNPGRFATLGPSAGWSSFYSYARLARPTGAIARARASSDTNVYLPNLARRGAYVIHGTRDDNVPITEGRAMVTALRMHTDDVQFHEEPGAGHWWDGDRSPGADCVDWPPLFAFMQAHTLDPAETDFRFVTPSPYVTPGRSYVTVRSCTDPNSDCELTSSRAMDAVTLTTRNVRGMVLDGTILRSRGVRSLTVDGRAITLADGPIAVGPQDGKRPEQHGPLNQVFHRPFCFVYPDTGNDTARRYAAWLVSAWAVTGNGLACALPASRAMEAQRAGRNLVWISPEMGRVTLPVGVPFRWDGASITLGTRSFEGAAMGVVFPAGEGLGAVITTTRGAERLLWRYQPYGSTAGVPDYLVWLLQGSGVSGFFDATWRYGG